MTADVTRINTAAEIKLLDQFKSAHGDILGDLDSKRGQAIAHFAKAGLPHRRIESWHYTDLRTIMREAHPPTAMPDASTVAQARAHLERTPTSGVRAVLVDGHYIPELSSTESHGVTIRSLLDVLGEGPSAAADALAVPGIEAQESVLALNAALMQGGAIVTIAAGAEVAQPIELAFLTSGEVAAACTTRSLIQAGPRSRAVVVERHKTLGGAPGQGNHALVIDVAEGAKLDHVAIAPASVAGAQQVATVVTTLAAACDFTSFALVSGSGFVRRQGFVAFEGAQAKGALRGVALLDGEGHADTTLVVTHKATHCESREVFKHILDGVSTGVFQGKVIVAPGAQKTDGKMMSRAIFLADGANMYNKPELEIFADDVVCGHGATAGFLNEEQLFYLRARGIPQKEAEALLLEAFAAEAIEDVGTEAIRAELTESVGQWLRQRQG